MAHLSPSCSTIYFPFLLFSQLTHTDANEPVAQRSSGSREAGEADGAAVVRAAFLKEEAPAWL